MNNLKNKAFGTLSLGLFILCWSSLSGAAGIEGIYSGEMNLKLDDKPSKVPLQLALSTTGETVITQIGPQVFEERIVIDGAMLVDDEGGPYGIGHVTYNLDLSEIDMRYNRRDATLGQVPASFRLDGHVDASGNIKGRVISGLGGVVGSFDLKRTKQDVLKVSTKYVGVWEGLAKTTDGYSVNLQIGLGASERPQVNPPDHEFYYTPGKMGYISWNDQKAPFSGISIDYLRRSIVFSDNGAVESGPVATAECQLDADTNELVGTLYGVYKGKIATFRLAKRH